MGAARTIVAKTSDGRRKRNKPQIDAVVDETELPNPTGAELTLVATASFILIMTIAAAGRLLRR